MSPSCAGGSCYLRCDLHKEQLLELWLVYRVENGGRDAVGALLGAPQREKVASWGALERMWPDGVL